MSDFVIQLKDRSQFGSSNANRYRREDLIPVCVSFKGEESALAVVAYNEFFHMAERAKTSQVFTFKSDNKRLNGVKAIVKNIQKEYLKDKVLHVDFQALKPGEHVTVKVPLQIVGVAQGVKVQGGILTPGAREVKLRVLDEAIPEILDVDVSALRIGETILASDLKLPEGATLLSSPREALAGVIESRASRLAEIAASTAAKGQKATTKDKAATAPAAAATKPATKKDK
ncbi:MAG: 50S ribosomal protein L25 [Bdellovibrionota bacterium]